jgi:hypothetical protein
MGLETRGRPRKEGERYKSGKLKPAPAPAAPSSSEPMSGALWQRMLRDQSRVFSDATFATELTRLGTTGQLTPREVGVGLRIAGIYGRFEYHQHLSRSAASPYYTREFAAAAVADADISAITIDTDREIASALEADDREEREREATRAFRELQGLIPLALRRDIEALCVENLHVGHQQLLAVRAALEIVADGLPDKTTGLSRKKRRALRKRIRPSLPEPTKARPIKLNPLKDAFIQVQRQLAPQLDADDLEAAWADLCARRAREDFRLEQSEGGRAR